MAWLNEITMAPVGNGMNPFTKSPPENPVEPAWPYVALSQPKPENVTP